MVWKERVRCGERRVVRLVGASFDTNDPTVWIYCNLLWRFIRIIGTVWEKGYKQLMRSGAGATQLTSLKS